MVSIGCTCIYTNTHAKHPPSCTHPHVISAGRTPASASTRLRGGGRTAKGGRGGLAAEADEEAAEYACTCTHKRVHAQTNACCPIQSHRIYPAYANKSAGWWARRPPSPGGDLPQVCAVPQRAPAAKAPREDGSPFPSLPPPRDGGGVEAAQGHARKAERARARARARRCRSRRARPGRR